MKTGGSTKVVIYFIKSEIVGADTMKFSTTLGLISVALLATLFSADANGLVGPGG